MRDVGCKLLHIKHKQDEKGVSLPDGTITREIPIIDEESIYSNEFYQANEQGYKPTLRLIISILNYKGEKELIYMGTTYTVIRTQKKNEDELILICERKVKNV